MRNLKWTESELSKFIKVCCMMTAGNTYASFAQTQELLSKDRGNIDLIKYLCRSGKLKLINSENDFESFLDNRKDMYGNRRDHYKCYFARYQPLREAFSKSPKLDTTRYIKAQLTHLVSASAIPNWITYDEISRVKAQRNFIQNELQEENFAATYSLYIISKIEPKPQEVRLLGDISSKLFKMHYADAHDMVSPTGLFNDPVLEDVDQFPFFDIALNFSILSALGLDRLIVSEEYASTLLSFILHNDFHKFIEAKNRFLGIVQRTVSRNDGQTRDRSIYIPYLRRLEIHVRSLGQNFDPIAYCEVIASTTRDLIDADMLFAKAMDDEDKLKMARNNIVLFSATEIEDEIIKSLLLINNFQHIGKNRAGEYFYNTYSLYDTIHIHYIRTSMGSGNVGGSQRVSHELFNTIRPDYAISTGICFGADQKKQTLGDVIVADGVRMYESAAAREGKFHFRGPSVTLHPQVPSYALNSAGDSWKFKIHVGAMLTGEKLVDDKDFKALIMSMDPKAAGGEMEAAGIQTSASVKGIPFALIKGICDWGEEKTKNFQEVAAQNAVEYTLALIKEIWGSKKH
ncbi:hypothetical protein [Rhizobium sp. TH135]|uniref:5'-methylthioadenosine/S-adenosylhomocysteine nucleosidase family protein n=1 Tax=Rhizobium sp. TH135 TaxID=2067451 RepID=UPI0015592B6D|nr:hypothetical protein [Rhizobium sp. TH135]